MDPIEMAIAEALEALAAEFGADEFAPSLDDCEALARAVGE